MRVRCPHCKAGCPARAGIGPVQRSGRTRPARLPRTRGDRPVDRLADASRNLAITSNGLKTARERVRALGVEMRATGQCSNILRTDSNEVLGEQCFQPARASGKKVFQTVFLTVLNDDDEAWPRRYRQQPRDNAGAHAARGGCAGCRADAIRS